jgi:hypothetical protein
MAARVQREICRVVVGIGVVLRGLTIADLLNSMGASGRRMDELSGREAQSMCGRRDALQCPMVLPTEYAD